MKESLKTTRNGLNQALKKLRQEILQKGEIRRSSVISSLQQELERTIPDARTTSQNNKITIEARSLFSREFGTEQNEGMRPIELAIEGVRSKTHV